MAVTGMGDVLGGIIGSLLAQGLDVYSAAKLGVYIHGLAGDLAFKKFSYGLLPDDLIDILPTILF
jgi:NAD(P)H-hydrate epimerase